MVLSSESRLQGLPPPGGTRAHRNDIKVNRKQISGAAFLLQQPEGWQMAAGRACAKLMLPELRAVALGEVTLSMLEMPLLSNPFLFLSARFCQGAELAML